MEIAAAYRVRKAGTSADFHGIVPPRRGTSMSFPGLDWEKEDQVRKAMFDEWGLSEYRDCLTAEMPIRPIPHVFEASRVAPLTQVWRKYSPYLYHRIFRELRPTAQPFNKDSKLGWPFFTRPESKLRTLRPFFRSLMDEGAEIAKGGYITMNVRLQPERPDRDRDFNFLDGDGVPYSASATAELRTVETRIGKKISSRTRLVFNMPAPNLFKQILDSAIHAVLLKYPIFHHDLHSRGGTLPVHGVHVCADIAHFERTTAVIVRERGAMLGGLYGDITQVFADLPFLCPSDDWRNYYFVNVNREAGWSDQFASGDSAVAPVQKEILMSLFIGWAVEQRGFTPEGAITSLLQGGLPGKRIVTGK